MAAPNWQTAILGTSITYQRGFAFKSSEYRPHGHPVVRVSDFTDRTIKMAGCNYIDPGNVPKYLNFALSTGDVVIATVGSWPSNEESVVGKAIRVPPEADGALLNQNAVRLRGTGELNQRFLFYLLRTEHFQTYIVGAAQGSANQASITLRDIFAYEFPFPRLHEQRAIAHILGTLDDKIELNRRMNETLEAMARALFKSWFVDFDPVRAKAEGRDPGLPKPLADLFPDSFDDSELGEIPHGWEVKTIEAIATRVGMGPFGSSIKVASFVPKGVPVISGQHLHGFMVEDTTFNFVTQEHAERLKAANVQRGDVVFTHAGNIGQVAYIPENSRYDRYVISQRQFFMRCDPAQVTPSFVAFYFRSPEGRHRLLANASSSGVPSIARPVTYLRSIRLTMPPKPIMDAFEKLLQPLLAQFRRNLDEGSALATVRDTLLPKLVSGELRVKDPAGFVEGVVA